MATNIPMPKFGLSMEEGTIGAWLVKEGDSVTKGQAIAEVASEKLSNEATAPEDGVIAKLLIEEGDTLPCGEPIAVLAAPGEDMGAAGAAPAAAAPAPVAESAAPVPAVAAAPAPVAAAAPAAPQSGEAKITPRAKKIAEAKGLAYAHITGTGRHGFITIEDLKREGRPLSAAPAPAAAAPVAVAAPVAPVAAYAPAPAGGQEVRMSPMQMAVAKGMYQSLSGTAQTTIMTQADVQPLTGVYASLKGKYAAAGFKLSYTAMLVKAVAQALENHPDVRMRLVDDTHYTIIESIDIGIAVDVPGGLVVPVIRQANLKDLRTICAELADLSARARAGALVDGEMGNGCLTITNLGMFGITYFTPVLNLPEPCILGVGAITQTPVARDGGIFVDAVMNLSLTHDHRTVNGAPAARFLQEVVANLKDFRYV